MRTLLPFLLCSLAACGPTQPSPTQAVIEVSAAPDSITGGPCAGCGAGSTDREAVTTLTIRETAGVGGAITSIAMTLRETGTNQVLGQGTFDEAAVAQIAGTARIDASGSLTVRNVGSHYPPDLAGRTATLTLVVAMRDDRGNVVTSEVVVPVRT